ncbi:MAG: hypothetical protein HYV29_09290 [Ignavibacteriales bacterium]|nr:hypothetical protein [Ignavibacteriales bacterium]
MLLRFILWMILFFIAAKIIGATIRYLRRTLTPNRHIKDQQKRSNVEEYKNVEDVPYEDVSNKK